MQCLIQDFRSAQETCTFLSISVSLIIDNLELDELGIGDAEEPLDSEELVSPRAFSDEGEADEDDEYERLKREYLKLRGADEPLEDSPLTAPIDDTPIGLFLVHLFF